MTVSGHSICLSRALQHSALVYRLTGTIPRDCMTLPRAICLCYYLQSMWCNTHQDVNRLRNHTFISTFDAK
jgi:hypothetical protein